MKFTVKRFKALILSDSRLMTFTVVTSDCPSLKFA